MPHFAFRRMALSTLTRKVGVYVLCDLDNVPIYVGKSTDGIRQRVARHLTSARSDIIANRQVDVWEIAYVWTFPVDDRERISDLEALLFNFYNSTSRLMNGSVLPSVQAEVIPEPAQIVQVMSDDDIRDRRDATQRLPRQAGHYAQLVDHFLTVKNSSQIARAMDAHFERLQKYHRSLLGLADDQSE